MASHPVPPGVPGPLVTPPPLQDDVGSQESDPIDQILRNYTFEFNPEYRLKLKSQLKTCSLSIAIAKPPKHPGARPDVARPRLRLMVKPAADLRISKWLHKLLVVPTHGLACVYSNKIRFGFFRLQFMASYNWITKQPSVDYSITTKWSDGPRIKRKETYDLRGYGLLRCKWNLDMQLPDLEGHWGADSADNDPWDVSYGRMEFEIPQIDLVLNSPWNYNPVAEFERSDRQGAASSSGRHTSASSQPAWDEAAADSSSSSFLRGARRASSSSSLGSSTAANKGSDDFQDREAMGGGKRGWAGGTGPSTSLSAAPSPAAGSQGLIGGGGVSKLGGAGAVLGGGNSPPDWLITFLSKLSIKPLNQATTS